MPDFSPQGVFLSYRRDDAGPYARSLQRDLKQRFPDAPIFMDVDSIEAGLDFAEVIEERVNSCAVLVALIGQKWATLTDEDGARRLDNPDDYVRFEVKTALERKVRVIPVLIDGARPLRQQELPEELHKLARLNAHKLSYDRYQDDADRLLDLIQRVLAAAGELVEAERKARVEADRKARVEADRKAQEEAERKAQEEAERKAQEEAERKARVEAERKSREKAKLKALVEAEQKAEDEAELQAALHGEWTAEVEADRTDREGAGRNAQNEAELMALEERARAAVKAEDAAGARDQYAALLAVRERVSGPEHPDTLTVRWDLARWTGMAGDAAGARDQYAALLPIYERVSGPLHPDTFRVHRILEFWKDQVGRPSGGRKFRLKR